MTTFEQATLWTTGLAAAATFMAVLVALFGERLRQHWTAPKLTLHLEPPAFNTTSNLARAGWYFIIRVSNERVSSPAANTRVLLTRVSKRAPDGSWQESPFSGPVQVEWRWSDMMPRYATVGSDEFATFGALLEGDSALQLRMFWYPNNLDPYIRANEPTRLDFRADSDTARSDEFSVEVRWDGVWESETSALVDHLTVVPVREGRSRSRGA